MPQRVPIPLHRDLSAKDDAINSWEWKKKGGIRSWLLACRTWSGDTFSNMNDAAIQEESEKRKLQGLLSLQLMHELWPFDATQLPHPAWWLETERKGTSTLHRLLVIARTMYIQYIIMSPLRPTPSCAFVIHLMESLLSCFPLPPSFSISNHANQ